MIVVRKVFMTLFAGLYWVTVQGQFHISMDILGHPSKDLCINENDEMVAIFSDPPFQIHGQYLCLIPINPNTLQQNGVKLRLPISHSIYTESHFTLLKKSRFINNQLFIQHTLTLGDPGIAIIGFNFEDNTAWAKKSESLSTGITNGDFFVHISVILTHHFGDTDPPPAW